MSSSLHFSLLHLYKYIIPLFLALDLVLRYYRKAPKCSIALEYVLCNICCRCVNALTKSLHVRYNYELPCSIDCSVLFLA